MNCLSQLPLLAIARRLLAGAALAGLLAVTALPAVQAQEDQPTLTKARTDLDATITYRQPPYELEQALAANTLVVTSQFPSDPGAALVSSESEEAIVVSLDSDGDGLSDDEEAALGTNPYDPDTDDDGLGDGSEVANGFDPLTPTVR
jgi:hypothetical protein